MKKIEIKVPDGIRYLSDWNDFGKELPDCHLILNKAHTGVGATHYFLTNNEKTIVCSPRCSLIDCKRSKHPNVWFYRDMNDNVSSDGEKIKATPKIASYADIVKYNEEVVSYLQRCNMEGRTPKIMVTYDSLRHVMNALESVGISELDTWTLVIDEFQVIFGDSSFKSLTEMMFLENSKSFKKAVFLSATPYLQTYMEQLDEFKDLPYFELVWPEEMQERAIVTNIPIRKGKSRISICCDIIMKMKAGDTIKFGTEEIDTKEAVFYINNVSDIIRIVKKTKLTPADVNILCSKSNEDRLKKEGFPLGNYPEEGALHKMFTFATKSVFLGVDFYSRCAMSYVFSDPSQNTLALDISTDLPQILGRQRLECNPYRHKAILFFKENSLGLCDDDFSKYIEKKKKDTEMLIDSFKTMGKSTQELHIKKYRSSMLHERYKDDYLMVVDDRKTKQPILAFNTLYMLAEIRAWEISKKNFASEYSIMREQGKVGIIATSGTMSTNSEVLSFKERFEGTRISDKRIKEYCLFRKQHPELITEVDFVSPKYADYWDALSFDNLKALGFQESKIKEALMPPSPFDGALSEAVIDIRNRLKGKQYSSNEIKKELKQSYMKHGVKKTPLAIDIQKYLTVKLQQDSKTGKRYYVIQNNFQKRISMFPFVWRPNIPMELTIDRFLEIVQTGQYTIKKTDTEQRVLKDVVTEIRSLETHEAQGILKKDWLPVACVNGVFKYKQDHGLEIYSSFIAIDLDGYPSKEAMNVAKEELKQHPWIYAIFETPSGSGLKAIVLHDSTNPTCHWNLYKQIMDKCDLPHIDSGVIDLSRGHFFSYDPNLWVNPSPEAYHFVYDPSIGEPKKSDDIYVSISERTPSHNETKLDSWTKEFLHELWQSLLTDEAILERLDKHWTEKRPEYFKVGSRHKSMLVIAGTLCKAGIPKEKTIAYLTKVYPEKSEGEIKSIAEYSYEYNAFGCNRRTFKKKL